ncbi:MAG: acyltransferase, partial [Actinomycetota bacterium]|nr:acyltransferase [Actinomycetota bacterium]
MTFRARRADFMLNAYEWYARRAAIHPKGKRGRRFASFGEGSIMCFPPAALFGEHAIRIGKDTLIGPYVSLSAGMGPNQELLSDRIVQIGDRVLIGRGSSIVGHFGIVIEDDVFFGPNVYVTDQNHGFSDKNLPIGKQTMAEEPVRIGWGSWIGTNSVILPGVTIGKQVAVGAGSIVTADLPDNCVAVGS